MIYICSNTWKRIGEGGGVGEVPHSTVGATGVTMMRNWKCRFCTSPYAVHGSGRSMHTAAVVATPAADLRSVLGHIPGEHLLLRFGSGHVRRTGGREYVVGCCRRRETVLLYDELEKVDRQHDATSTSRHEPYSTTAHIRRTCCVSPQTCKPRQADGA